MANRGKVIKIKRADKEFSATSDPMLQDGELLYTRNRKIESGAQYDEVIPDHQLHVGDGTNPGGDILGTGNIGPALLYAIQTATSASKTCSQLLGYGDGIVYTPWKSETLTEPVYDYAGNESILSLTPSRNSTQYNGNIHIGYGNVMFDGMQWTARVGLGEDNNTGYNSLFRWNSINYLSGGTDASSIDVFSGERTNSGFHITSYWVSDESSNKSCIALSCTNYMNAVSDKVTELIGIKSSIFSKYVNGVNDSIYMNGCLYDAYVPASIGANNLKYINNLYGYRFSTIGENKVISNLYGVYISNQTQNATTTTGIYVGAITNTNTSLSYSHGININNIDGYYSYGIKINYCGSTSSKNKNSYGLYIAGVSDNTTSYTYSSDSSNECIGGVISSVSGSVLVRGWSVNSLIYNSTILAAPITTPSGFYCGKLSLDTTANNTLLAGYTIKSSSYNDSSYKLTNGAGYYIHELDCGFNKYNGGNTTYGVLINSVGRTTTNSNSYVSYSTNSYGVKIDYVGASTNSSTTRTSDSYGICVGKNGEIFGFLNSTGVNVENINSDGDAIGINIKNITKKTDGVYNLYYPVGIKISNMAGKFSRCIDMETITGDWAEAINISDMTGTFSKYINLGTISGSQQCGININYITGKYSKGINFTGINRTYDQQDTNPSYCIYIGDYTGGGISGIYFNNISGIESYGLEIYNVSERKSAGLKINSVSYDSSNLIFRASGIFINEIYGSYSNGIRMDYVGGGDGITTYQNCSGIYIDNIYKNNCGIFIENLSWEQQGLLSRGLDIQNINNNIGINLGHIKSGIGINIYSDASNTDQAYYIYSSYTKNIDVIKLDGEISNSCLFHIDDSSNNISNFKIINIEQNLSDTTCFSFSDISSSYIVNCGDLSSNSIAFNLGDITTSKLIKTTILSNSKLIETTEVRNSYILKTGVLSEGSCGINMYQLYESVGINIGYYSGQQTPINGLNESVGIRMGHLYKSTALYIGDVTADSSVTIAMRMGTLYGGAEGFRISGIDESSIGFNIYSITNGTGIRISSGGTGDANGITFSGFNNSEYIIYSGTGKVRLNAPVANSTGLTGTSVKGTVSVVGEVVYGEVRYYILGFTSAEVMA